MPVFSKMYNVIRERILTDGGDIKADPTERCTSCRGRERLLDFRHLKPGGHITLSGQNCLMNIDDKQVAMYTHHAIVKDVKLVTLCTAMVTLIHFYSTPFDLDIRIQETTEMLDLYYHEVYMISYRHGTHPPDVIIERAMSFVQESRVKDVKYSLFNCNCEHFCNWCCVGNQDSFQVNNFTATLGDFLSGIINVGGKIIKTICKLFSLSVDDISKVAALTIAPWVILSGVSVLFFIYTIYRHIQISKQLKKGEICTSCCRRQKIDNCCRFAAYCALQVGGLFLLSLVIAVCASKGIVIGVLSVLAILTLAITSSIRKIRNIICSPFQGKLVRVTNMDQICEGDAIYFDHWKMNHAAIVSEVTKHDATSGKLKVIHYSLPKMFGTRVIVEEDLAVNLEKDHLVRHDYSGYRTYSADEVVERARKRIGETKFGVLSNRSCHFTYWAKVKENTIFDPVDLEQNEDHGSGIVFLRSVRATDSIRHLPPVNIDHRANRKHATKTLGSVRANIRDEIYTGQIVEFKYGGFRHRAISTKVTNDDEVVSKLGLTVVHFNKDKHVVEETFVFDLRYENIWIHPLHPINCFSPCEVIRRARARIGRGDYSILYNRSCHLAKEVVMTKDKLLATHMDDIKPGDVAIITYWGCYHFVVVTKVKPTESKDNNTGQINIVHYALEHLFATRTVKQEEIPVDLSKDRIYIKDFRGYVTYPPERVVGRALSRIGEQRFNAISNTSAKVAFWAKVVQTPSIISYDCFEIEASEKSANQALLLPQVGKKYNGLQKVPAYSWDDLRLGMIIEYTYYWIPHQGILTDIDKTSNSLKVIHYGAKHIFAKRTIMENTLTINMGKDTLMIYRVDPTKANKQQVILQKAKARLGEQNWKSGNRSWDFCLSCVLKPQNKEV